MIEPINIYKNKVKYNELNLVWQVNYHLQHNISKEVADIFNNDPLIASVKTLPAYIQRVYLNRYFFLLLTGFRARTNIPVHNTLFMLVDDGIPEDWFVLFTSIITPFLKNNKVFETMYDFSTVKSEVK